MKTKVTLSMDRDFVEKAKQFAKEHKKSLSALTEESIRESMEQQNRVRERLSTHKQLAGSINLPDDIANKDWDELRWEALKEKHGLP